MPDPRPTACPHCNEPLFPVDPESPSSETLSPLPQNSAITIWHATPDRRIFHLRGGKGFPIIFSVIWLTIVAFISAGMVTGAKFDGDARVGAAILGAFWIIGFVLIYVGVRHRYLRITVLLERNRLVIERNLLGWKSAEETSLEGVGVADLVVAYEQNYQPVFAVRVSGVEKKIQFGAPLEIADKNWLVDEINGFLAGRLPGTTGDDEPNDLTHASSQELESIIGNAGVSVNRPNDDTLILLCRASQLPCSARVAIAVACAGFAGAWYAGVSIFLTQAVQTPFPMNIAIGLFMMPFLFAGLIPLGIAAATLWGQVQVEVGPREVVGSVGVGRFAIKRRLPTRDIDFVGANGGEDNRRWRSRPATTAANCVVRAGTKSIPLWTPSSPRTCRAIAELIRRQLPHMGV